jgi:hypothetical protein
MKNIAIILILFWTNTQLLAKNTNADSLRINIDKRTKTIISEDTENVKGYSLLSDLKALFKSKNMTLTDSTWRAIREIVNADSHQDTLLKFSQDGKQIVIAFDMKNMEKLAENPSPSDSSDKDWNNDRENKESVKIGWDGIHIKDGNDEVHVSRKGVKIVENGEASVDIGWNGTEEDSTAHKKWENKHNFGSLSGFNVMLGLNALTSQNGLDDSYALRPFGSRYFSMGWTKSTNITNGSNARLKLAIGINFSWYNFMLENSNSVWVKGPTQVEILPTATSLKKSKLTVSYIDVPITPYIAFKKGKFIEHFGFGGYVGYKMGSHSKTKANNKGRKEKEFNNFYLNDFRYGLNLQLGLHNFADLFVNYDLNELFKTNKGPKVNGISFGIRL